QLFDRLIGDGQTALVFLEFSALGLPRLITTVLPIATFAAAIYVTNRLNNESELTVMMSTGTSPWRLARPVAVFGLISALMMSVLSHVLVPTASAQLSEREIEVSRNVTSRLLTEGAFLSPASGVTFYTRAIDDEGVLKDVFLADRRAPDERVIYTASEAYLVRSDEGTSLIMVDGLSQRLSIPDSRLSTGKFQDFSFDISSLMKSDASAVPDLEHELTTNILLGWAATAERYPGMTTGNVAEVVHGRFARAAFCFVTALIGFATLLVGGFSRFGVWREIVIAFLLLIILDGLRSTLSTPVIDDARMWPILYLPSSIGLALVAGLLWFAAGGRAKWQSLRRRTA
ncbi:MAG: LptF/LptG family permease, partial [Tateyamaria sp.]